MKPSLLPLSSARRLAWTGVVLALSAAILPAAQKKTAPAPVAAPREEGKEYTLFMGTDFSVPQGKEYYRVRDVSGGSFIIKVKDKEVQIPMRHGTGNLKVDQGLKLTATSARIDKLKTERTYTPENDPYHKFKSSAGAAQGSSDVNFIDGLALSGANNAVTGAANAAIGDLRASGSVSAATQQGIEVAQIAQLGAARNFDESSYQKQFSSFNNPGLAALELANELAEENFDALRYSFEVSSETPLNRPYLVFIVRFREKDAKPGTGGTTIFAKPIEPIGLQPAKINVIQKGLPVGFIVEETQVRLYNNGQEIATNVAPRRVPLDRDEAFEYMLIEHLGRHKGATLDAAPALGKLNEATKSRLNRDQLKHVYYVKVSPEGRAVAAFRDEACSQPVDDIVSGVISNVRFYPALEQGRATEGVARLAFHQLGI